MKNPRKPTKHRIVNIPVLKYIPFSEQPNRGSKWNDCAHTREKGWRRFSFLFKRSVVRSKRIHCESTWPPLPSLERHVQVFCSVLWVLEFPLLDTSFLFITHSSYPPSFSMPVEKSYSFVLQHSILLIFWKLIWCYNSLYVCYNLQDFIFTCSLRWGLNWLVGQSRLNQT